jgi:O-antigen/teichoic acid export membrane protein
VEKRLHISKRLLAVNSTSSLLAWVLKTALLFGLQRYLLQRVSVEEYSLFPVMASILMFVELVRPLLVGGISRFIVDADVRGDASRVTQITSTMFVVQASASVALLGLGFVLTRYIDVLLEIDPRFVDDARLMLGLMIVSFAFQLSTTALETGLFARQRFVLMNGLELASVALRIGLIIVFFTVADVRVLWVTVAAESANVAVHLVQLAISRRLIPALRIRWKEIEWDQVRPLMAFSFWTFIQTAAHRTAMSLDPLILNRLAGPFQVTVFYIGTLFKRQIGAVLQRLTAPIVPSLIGLHATNEHDRLRNAYYRYGRYFIWANVMLALPLVIYRQELISLYVGPQYMTSATVMAILFMATFVGLGNDALPKMAIALGRMRYLALASVGMQAFNIGLTLYLVGVLQLGAIGSALGSAITAVTLQPLAELLIAHRLLGIRLDHWLRRTVLPGFLPAVGGSAVWLGIRLLDSPDSWLKLFLYSAAGGLVYIALALGVFVRTEQGALQMVWMRLRGRHDPV